MIDAACELRPAHVVIHERVQHVYEQARLRFTCFLAGAEGHSSVQRGVSAHQPRTDSGLRGSLDRGVGQRMPPNVIAVSLC